MNEIDPARRFSMNAVRKFDGPAESEAASGLNDVARQVASQYRRDTMSPIMVSGVLRMVEFALLFVSGLCLYFYYVGFFNYLAWQYPVTIAAASFLRWCCSTSPIPTRSPPSCGRSPVLAGCFWSGPGLSR